METINDFELYLSPKYDLFGNYLNSNYIVIYPDRDNFNDFGYNTKVFIEINYLGKELRLNGFFGVPSLRENENGKYFLQRLQKLTPVNNVFYDEMKGNENKKFFFTMLRDLMAYRSLVMSLGVELAQRISNLLNDITISPKSSEVISIRKLMLDSDVFNKSFIRNAESYIAFNNAQNILRGLEYENYSMISNEFVITGTSHLPDLSFSFSHISQLPKRVSVIIGENGIGKSRILNKIVNEALEGNDGLYEPNRKSNSRSRISLNRILAFSPTSEIGNNFPSDKSKINKIWYRKFSLNRLDFGGFKNTITGILVELMRSDEIVMNTRRVDLFFNSLSKINNFKEIVLVLKNNTCISLFDLHRFNEEHKLECFKLINCDYDPLRLVEGKTYPLSSGEISFIRFCAQACAYIENGSLLILDEPETHLHPSFISNFFALLDELLRSTGSVAIIATHSVYFIREVFKEQVTVLKRMENNKVDFLKPRLNTFGADIGTISYFVFGEDEPTKTLEEVKNNILKKYDNWQDIYRDFQDDLSINVLLSLRKSVENRGGQDE